MTATKSPCVDIERHAVERHDAAGIEIVDPSRGRASRSAPSEHPQRARTHRAASLATALRPACRRGTARPPSARREHLRALPSVTPRRSETGFAGLRRRARTPAPADDCRVSPRRASAAMSRTSTPLRIERDGDLRRISRRSWRKAARRSSSASPGRARIARASAMMRRWRRLLRRRLDFGDQALRNPARPPRRAPPARGRDVGAAAVARRTRRPPPAGSAAPRWARAARSRARR